MLAGSLLFPGGNGLVLALASWAAIVVAFLVVRAGSARSGRQSSGSTDSLIAAGAGLAICSVAVLIASSSAVAVASVTLFGCLVVLFAWVVRDTDRSAVPVAGSASVHGERPGAHRPPLSECHRRPPAGRRHARARPSCAPHVRHRATVDRMRRPRGA